MVFTWVSDDGGPLADGAALAFEDINEFIGRFNATMHDCDFCAATRFIEALFTVDRNDAQDEKSCEVQRNDLLCQCLNCFGTRIWYVHEQRRHAPPPVPRRPVTHFDAKSIISVSDLSFDDDAIKHLAAVNAAIRRHTASQRFHRTWLNQPAHRGKREEQSKGAGSQTPEMSRFERTTLQSFLIEIELRRRLALEQLSAGDAASATQSNRLALAAFERLQTDRMADKLGLPELMKEVGMARTAQQRAVHYARFNQCQKSRSLSSLAAELLASVLWLNEDAHAICAASDIWGMSVAQLQACVITERHALNIPALRDPNTPRADLEVMLLALRYAVKEEDYCVLSSGQYASRIAAGIDARDSTRGGGGAAALLLKEASERVRAAIAKQRTRGRDGLPCPPGVGGGEADSSCAALWLSEAGGGSRSGVQEDTKREVWQRMTLAQQQKFQQMSQEQQKQMFEALVRVHLQEKKRLASSAGSSVGGALLPHDMLLEHVKLVNSQDTSNMLERQRVAEVAANDLLRQLETEEQCAAKKKSKKRGKAKDSKKNAAGSAAAAKSSKEQQSSRAAAAEQHQQNQQHQQRSSSSCCTAAAAAGSAAAVLEWFGGSSARGGERVGGERERGARQRGQRASGERERRERETEDGERGERAQEERASEESETAERVWVQRDRAAAKDAEDAQGQVGGALIEQAELASSAPDSADCELSLLYQPESACPERGASLRKMQMAEDAQGQGEDAKKKESAHPDYTTLNEASATACVARGAEAEADRSTSAKRIEDLEKEVDALREAAKTIKNHWQGILLKREDHWQGILQERERAGERERERERADEGAREREREEAAVMKERDALRSEFAALSGAPQLLSRLSDAALDALKTEQEEALARVNAEVQTRLDTARAREQVADRHEAFRCPISLSLMHEPVFAADGHTYEREEIERWIQRAQARGVQICSPVTNAVLPYPMLTPNHSMRSMIMQALQDNMPCQR